MVSVNQTPNRWIPSAEVRKYIYRVLAIALPLAGLYLPISPEHLPLWLELAGVILGVTSGGALGLASVNTPRPVEVPVATQSPSATVDRETKRAQLNDVFTDFQARSAARSTDTERTS